MSNRNTVNTIGNWPSLRINGMKETRIANQKKRFSTSKSKASINEKLKKGSVKPPRIVSVVSCADNKISGNSSCNQLLTPFRDRIRKAIKTVEVKSRMLNTTIPLNPNWANGELIKIKNGLPQ